MTLNTDRPLPESIRKAMVPSWFDISLFPDSEETIDIDEKDWRSRLTPPEYDILRSEGTERPFDNKYYETETEGVYVCRGCSNPIFSSVAKFRSASGWPSFFAPISQKRIGISSDTKLLMERTEVHCARCGGHLGHVFDDGPDPTGLRYCLNSSALELIDQEKHDSIRGDN